MAKSGTSERAIVYTFDFHPASFSTTLKVASRGTITKNCTENRMCKQAFKE